MADIFHKMQFDSERGSGILEIHRYPFVHIVNILTIELYDNNNNK